MALSWLQSLGMVLVLMFTLSGCISSAGNNLDDESNQPKILQDQMTTSSLELSLPGYEGDISFGFTAEFPLPRICDLTFGAAGSTSAEEPILYHYNVTGPSFEVRSLAGRADGFRVHVDPIDTRPAMNLVRELVSGLNPSGYMTTYANRELSDSLDIWIAGDGVKPHDEFAGAGLLVRIECDGPFEWGNLEGGLAVKSFVPESFEGNGLHAIIATHDSSTTASFEIPGDGARGMLWNTGAFMENGSLRLQHVDDEINLEFPGDLVRGFTGPSGYYHTTLDRMTLKPNDGFFALLVASTNPLTSLDDLLEQSSG